MKILICAGNRQIQGGAETYLRAILPRLAGLGFRVGFLYERDEPNAPAVDEGAKPDRAWGLTPANRDAIWAAVQDWRPAVIFNNGMYDSEFESQLTRYPVVYFAHNYAGTCLSGFKRHAWPSAQPCYRTLGLGCLAYYFPRRCGGLSPLPLLKDYLHTGRRLAMMRACAFVQVASEAMRAEYLRHGFVPERVVLNPLFPTCARPDPEAPAERAPSGVVLLAGRLTQIKGGAYLVEAMHLARRQPLHGPALQLSVAGEGPERPSLQALADRLGVPAQFHGWLDAGKLGAEMRRADLLAMPSVWPEPFGLLGIEAGCFGVPSVGYAHGGITDWLVEGKSGALAPSPPTAAGLAQAIVRVLGDPQRHQHLRVGAWQMAQRFRIERHLHQLDESLRLAATVPARRAVRSTENVSSE